MVQINELKRMLDKKNADEIWALYGLIESELKERGKIRSGNLTSRALILAQKSFIPVSGFIALGVWSIGKIQ